MTAGQVKLPIVYMAVIGGGRSASAQHSDIPYPALMNLGGIKVVVPSNSRSAKGLLKSAIRDDNPVFYLTAASGGKPEEVPDDEEFLLPIGKAERIKEGRDVTIISIGAMTIKAIQASQELQDNGISVDLIDLLSLLPIDEETLINSAKKTGRVVIVDESRDVCSAASHIAAIISDKAFEYLKSPIKRITVQDVAIPYSPKLEGLVIPDAKDIVNTVNLLIKK
jgi:pyruvate dehydrogenase E1 component beta subunit